MSKHPSSDGLYFRVLRKLYDLAGWKTKDDIIRHAHRGYEAVSYRRLRELGLRPNTIVDVGAYRGDWSRGARAVFPDAHIIMVEAQPGLRSEIEAAASEVGNARAYSALLSAAGDVEVPFHVMGTGSSIKRENSDVEAATTYLRTSTLDRMLPDDLERPLFLKLDTQGAEIDVLSGGLQVLGQTDYVQMEVALQQYNDGAPLMADVLRFMQEHDFLATDITGFSRPRDHLVQVDLLFARKDSPLRPKTFELG